MDNNRFICRESGFLSPEQIEDYRKDGIVVVDRFPPKKAMTTMQMLAIPVYNLRVIFIQNYFFLSFHVFSLLTDKELNEVTSELMSRVENREECSQLKSNRK